MTTSTFKSISAPQVRFDHFTGEIEFGEQPLVKPQERVARSEIKSFLRSVIKSDGERWITIHPHGSEEGGGTHVKISGDGKIVAGPAGLAARGITHLSDFGKGDGGGSEKKPISSDHRPFIASQLANRSSHSAMSMSDKKKPHELIHDHEQAANAHENAASQHTAVGNHDQANQHREAASAHRDTANRIRQKSVKHTDDAYEKPANIRTDKTTRGINDKPETPTKRPGVPGMQTSLFDEDPSGQRQLFNYVPPKKGDNKPKQPASSSMLEQIGDEQRDRERQNKPLSGQRSILNDDEADNRWSPEKHIKIAADSIAKLRGQDVYRLLDSAPPHYMQSMANYIQKHRPEFSRDIHDARLDIEEERAAKKKSLTAYKRWVTIHPHGRDAKGVHIEIDDDGNITKGPRHLAEAGIHHIGDFGNPRRPTDEHVAEMIPHAHQWLTEQHEHREAAKREARRYTGMNSGNLAWRENRGGRDYSSIAGFDRMAREFAEENPQYGFDKDEHDTPAKVWELIREGSKKKPTADSPEVRKIAEHWASESRKRPKFNDEDLPEWKSLTSARKGWITLKPHGDDGEGYVHVLIDGNGKILAGPKDMEGKNVAHLSDSHSQHGEESRTHPAPKTPKDSVDNPPNTASIMSESGSEPDKNAKQNEGSGKVETIKRSGVQVKRIAVSNGQHIERARMPDGGYSISLGDITSPNSLKNMDQKNWSKLGKDGWQIVREMTPEEIEAINKLCKGGGKVDATAKPLTHQELAGKVSEILNRDDDTAGKVVTHKDGTVRVYLKLNKGGKRGWEEAGEATINPDGSLALTKDFEHALRYSPEVLNEIRALPTAGQAKPRPAAEPQIDRNHPDYDDPLNRMQREHERGIIRDSLERG